MGCETEDAGGDEQAEGYGDYEGGGGGGCPVGEGVEGVGWEGEGAGGAGDGDCGESVVRFGVLLGGQWC